MSGGVSYPRNPKQKKEERFVRGGADCEGAGITKQPFSETGARRRASIGKALDKIGHTTKTPHLLAVAVRRDGLTGKRPGAHNREAQGRRSAYNAIMNMLGLLSHPGPAFQAGG